MAATFGPQPYGPSDFLLGLEQTYCFIPATVVTCTLPFYLPSLRQRPCVRPNVLLWVKLGVVVALASVQLVTVMRWWRSGLDSSVLERLGAALSCTGAFSLAMMTYISHAHNVRSIPLLSLWLVITVFADIAITGTYFNPAIPGPVQGPQNTIVALNVALLLLEQVSKQEFVLREHLSSSIEQDEETPLTMLLKRIFAVVFRVDLTPEDRHRLEEDLDREKLSQSFMMHWEQAEKDSEDALLSACYAVLHQQYLWGILPRLLVVFFNLAQPLFVRDLLIAVSTHTPPAEIIRKLTVAAAMIYLNIATFNAWHGYERDIYVLSLRGLLGEALYTKSLKLRDQSLDTSEFMALVDNELTAAFLVATYYYDAWAGVLEVVLHTALLAYLTGFSSVLALAPVVIPMYVGVHLSRSSPKFQQIWSIHMKDRVAATSNILAQIKEVKMLGLGATLAKILQSKQLAEIKASMRMRENSAIGFCTSAVTETVTPIVAIGMAMFVTQPYQALSVAEFFTILVITAGIIRIAARYVRFASNNTRKLGSFTRIQKFLLQEENVDQRSLTREQMSHPDIVSSVEDTPHILALRRSARIAANRFVVKFVDVALAVGVTGPLLRKIRLNIPRGKVIMFFGETGHGKSTILGAIIGRVKLVEGHLIVSTITSVAYCSQEPWIQNLTIRENIVGANEYDAPWLRRVIWICALDVDLARFPNGDLTMAGSDGCNLSGGQKHRVAFARGLYAKAELLVLDDVFSSLDLDTSSTIRIRLFGQSQVLRTHNITLVMSTNTSEHLVDADTVYEIKSYGRVEERSLASRDNSPRFLPARLRAVQQPPEEEGEEEENENVPEHMRTTKNPQLELPVVRSRTNKEEPQANPTKANFGDLSLYWYALQPAGIVALIFWVFTVIAAAIVEKLPDILAAVWLYAAPDNHGFFILYAIVGVLNPVTNFVAAASHFYIVYPRTSAALHWRLAETTFKATFDHLITWDASHLLSKFSRDVTVTTEWLPQFMMPLAWAVVATLVDLVVMSIPFSSVIPLIYFLLVLYVLWTVSKGISRQLGTLESKGKKDLTKLVSETEAGLEHIHAFNWQEAFLNQFRAAFFELQAAMHRRRRLQTTLKMMLDYASAAAIIASVSYAVSSPSVSSNIAIGHAMIRLITFSDETNMIMIAWVRMEASLGAVARIRHFHRTAPQEQTVTRCEPVSPFWPVEGKVELNCVTAMYQPEDGEPFMALNNVSVKVNPGQTVCISGRTGSGKTSVFLTLLRMLEFTGSISIDDREIRTVPHDVLRSRITTITQTGLQLKGSVRFNMDPFDPALRPNVFLLTDEMLIGILRRVGLWDLIQQHGGLDSDMISLSLSYGQKQLFQLARAILHRQTMRTKIVLIDEGTSGMDPRTDRRMQQVIEEVFSDCTTLVVSHRPSMFNDADFIVSLSNGQADVYKHRRERQTWLPARGWR